MISDSPRAIVIIPTFNEIQNIDLILDRVINAAPLLNILVVDDNSPDGTGKRADERAAEDSRINVLHRTGKEGLGAAYRAGFKWALDQKYEILIEMDADGSHPPEKLLEMLNAISNADLVIGSRWVRGGSVVNWPLSRKILSRGGNLYARIMLGVKISDATAGFRVFRASTIEKLDLVNSNSQGYVFQVDSSFRASRLGLRVVEIPIQFTERALGASKMSKNIVLEAMWQVTKWAFKHRFMRRPL